MDLPRERPAGTTARRLAGATVLAALAAAAGYTLWSVAHGSNLYVVDRSTVVTDTVVRGTLVRSIGAAGAFAPERTRIVSAVQGGIVERLGVKPGSVVRPGSVIAVLVDPDLAAGVDAAEAELAVARANLADAQEQAGAAKLARQSALADATSQAEQDHVLAATDLQMASKGFIAPLTSRLASIKAAASSRDVAIDRAQVAVAIADARAKVAAAQAQVAEAAARLQDAQNALAALTIHAGTFGIVQSIGIDAGTRVAPGTQIASVADERDLKAVLQVPETQVSTVTLGVPVRVDAGDGPATGHVARIAPAANAGTVDVDVVFPPGGLPRGARPQANLDATIVLATLRDVLSIARPAGAADDTTIHLFRIVPRTDRAVRTTVRLGSGSAERVSVLSGLRAGDTVIVSDTSAFADRAAVRLQ